MPTILPGVLLKINGAMPTKAIIFDFDGVILDSVDVKTRAFESIYLPYGQEIAAEVVAHHEAHGGVSRYQKFRLYHQKYLGLDINEEQLDDLCTRFNQLVFQKVIASPYISGARNFIEEAFKRFELFICTGTPQTEIEEILEALSLTNYFTGVYGSPDNKIQIVQHIQKEYQLQSDELIFFGDASTDYEAAQHYGIKFIGVAGKTSPFPAGTTIIQSFDEIQAEYL
jgi:HAD superfamily hydrolase (TIGR01549 family)